MKLLRFYKNIRHKKALQQYVQCIGIKKIQLFNELRNNIINHFTILVIAAKHT